MPNQHTLTIPIAQATERQLLIHLVKITEAHMTAMTDAIDHLKTSLTKELEDVKAGLLAQIDTLTVENAADKQALIDKTNELDAAVQTVQQFALDLDANDAPATPAEPTPEPTPEPVNTDPAAPVDVDTPTDAVVVDNTVPADTTNPVVTDDTTTPEQPTA